jgi:hypothetical protein
MLYSLEKEMVDYSEWQWAESLFCKKLLLCSIGATLKRKVYTTVIFSNFLLSLIAHPRLFCHLLLQVIQSVSFYESVQFCSVLLPAAIT